MRIKINILNHCEIEYQAIVTPQSILDEIGGDIKLKKIVAEVDGDLWELSRPISKSCNLAFYSWDDEKGKKAFWHSSAHLLAEALKELFPNVKFGIGPPIDSGFYYDIDLGDQILSKENCELLEKKMLELAGKKSNYIRKDVTKQEAIQYFTSNYNEYKLELIENLQDGEITFYTQGTFTDLCKGGHIPDTSYINAVKILNVAGAYWRGDVKRKQMTRIYAITFPTQKELDDYLFNLEEAKKRNHQKIGKDLKIFTFSDKVGLGLPLWLPNGTIIKQRLQDFIYKDQLKNGYLPVSTPHIARKELYITSGHYDKYGEDSFQPIKTPNENEEYFLKPMNCPHHCEIFKSEPKSYRDLPLRLCEFGTVYRYEQHGELHGLARTRCLTQDDAHIFCTQDQIKEEFYNTIQRVKKVFEALTFKDYVARISVRDLQNLNKYIGDQEDWNSAENSIREVVKDSGIEYFEGSGEAAFYGPKLDFLVKDSLGRKWQLGTIQLDYQLPKRFELEYVGVDNKKHTPVMIHRAPLGSFERLFAILLEHTSGRLPVWLCPVQVTLLTISQEVEHYTKMCSDELQKNDIFCNVDSRNEKLSKKILEAEAQKIPYIIVVGKKEMEDNLLALRTRDGKSVSIRLEHLKVEILNKIRELSL